MMALLILGSFFLLLGVGVAASTLMDFQQGVMLSQGARGVSSTRILREDDPELFNQLIIMQAGFAVLSAIVGILCLWICIRLAWPRSARLRGLL